MLDVTLGEAVKITVAFTDAVNMAMAATGVTILVKTPDGVITAGTVSAAGGVGRFETTIVTNVIGTWLTKAECTGPAIAKDEDTFTVSRLRFDT